MKKAIKILFIVLAIIVEVSHDGYFAYITTGIGVIGLAIALYGAFKDSEK